MRVSLKYWLIGGLLLTTAVYALAEDITLTTYYPSPRGVYQELRTTSNAFFATDGGNVGIGTSTPTEKLDVIGDARIQGTVSAQAFGSLSPLIFEIAGVEHMRITDDGDIGIGTASPDSSAALDISSTTRGLLPPRMTEAERDGIATPTQGLLIFNTDEKLYNYHDGTTGWAPLASQASIPNVQAFDTSDFFTVPPGVTEIMVKVWGGGGGGASYTGTAGGGGGGAGGYAEGIFSVSPGDTLTVTVGDGGAGGVGFGAPGSAGAASGVGALISATGGAGGTGGTGGIGGSGTGGHLRINGSRGAPGLYNAGGAIAGGAGGTTGAGGGAGGPGDSAGIPGQGGGEAGQFPGGGGGGGVSVGPYPGADGAVIILF